MNNSQLSSTANNDQIEKLYQALIDSWNRRDAQSFAVLFTEDGETIGFDGSQLIGQSEIASNLHEIFSHHVTPPYITKVKDVRFFGPDTAILRAVVGMIPPGRTEIEPQLNAIQTLVATKSERGWLIAHLQTTPAQFHGRPDLLEQLTQEIEQVRSATHK
ncbi:hypothetical protein KDA_71210 [Dictyobacter alpinus]|uniref:DUF4440 domain-containing protein n=1 Tax=Dictyobacter alpinus TaxID=2014873 RepID=A0A402BJV9_9CHLR|nr:SgcJ/EcaC family oxidoreductase [Dictyobacter alpinus]GCE31637.1 hypothetical protein KDA_71210 [Dictyobacter alpinus]